MSAIAVNARGARRMGVGAFAVLDQVLFAGASFSINILLHAGCRPSSTARSHSPSSSSCYWARCTPRS